MTRCPPAAHTWPTHDTGFSDFVAGRSSAPSLEIVPPISLSSTPGGKAIRSCEKSSIDFSNSSMTSASAAPSQKPVLKIFVPATENSFRSIGSANAWRTTWRLFIPAFLAASTNATPITTLFSGSIMTGTTSRENRLMNGTARSMSSFFCFHGSSGSILRSLTATFSILELLL